MDLSCFLTSQEVRLKLSFWMSDWLTKGWRGKCLVSWVGLGWAWADVGSDEAETGRRNQRTNEWENVKLRPTVCQNPWQEGLHTEECHEAIKFGPLRIHRPMRFVTILPERTDWDIQVGLVRVAKIRCELIYVGKSLLNNGRETLYSGSIQIVKPQVLTLRAGGNDLDIS